MPYEIPSWLNPQPAGQAFISGVNAGSGVARNFLQARALAQQQQEQDAMLPLKQALYRNQIKNAALDIQKGLYDQQDYLMNKQAFVKLSDVARQISANAAWAKPESEAAIWKIASDYPSVVATPQFKEVVRQFDVAGAAAIKAKEAENKATKFQNDYELGTQKLGLAEQRIGVAEDRYKAEIASREKLAGEHEKTLRERNTFMLEAAKLKVDKAAKDRLGDMEYRAASEVFNAIADDVTLSPEAKERKMQAALQRAIDNAKTRKAGETNSPTAPKAAAAPSASDAKGREVRRILEGGRVGIFDAETKKFIRYAD